VLTEPIIGASTMRRRFTVYRWVKDDRQDDEALDTMIQATGAAIKYGVTALSDVSWMKLEAEHETPLVPDQADHEELMMRTSSRSCN